MAKKDCYLNHSRSLYESYKKDNYYYDIERSSSTAKQRKFYQKLWYIFKDNNIDINSELDKRNLPHYLIQNPSGRAEYSVAIDHMINILTELGLYQRKNDRQNEFVPTYNTQVDSGGKTIRSFQSVDYIGDKRCLKH